MIPPRSKLTLTHLKDSPARQAAAELADALRTELESGAFVTGDKLPSVRQLMQQTDLSYHVVSQALGLLADEGWVEQRHGAGTFVLERPSGPDGEPVTGRRIGVVPPSWGDSPSHYVMGAMLHGVFREADKRHHRVEIIHSEGDEWMRYGFADKVFSRELDGVVWVLPTPGSVAPLVRVLQAGLPAVVTGREFQGYPVPFVHTDLHALGEVVADYMVRHERRDLLCFVGRRNDLYSRQRVEALRAALEKRGIPLPDENVLSAYIGENDDHYSMDTQKHVREYLESHPRFDTVFNLYEPSLATLVELHNSGQRRCPEDFVILHLAQSPMPVRQVWPQIPITLINTPLEAIGRQAVRELERQWGFDVDQEEPVNLAPTLDEALQISGAKRRPAHV